MNEIENSILSNIFSRQKKLSKSQIKIIISFIILTIVILIGLYFYFNSMTLQKGNLNINKIEKKDKLYTYDVYSDFYFNVESYNEKAEKKEFFSKLIPTKTSIGFDLSKNPVELNLKNEDLNSDIVLSDSKDNEKLSKIIEYLNNFSKEYSEIVALQDISYLEKSKEFADKIIKDLYNENIDTKHLSFEKYFENKIDTPIKNIELKPFKLENINKNLRNTDFCQRQWCKDIAIWTFGDDDKITLEYITQVEQTNSEKTLNDFSKDSIVVKTTKVNNNIVSKYYFIRPNNEKEIRSYFIDENGYVYLLRYSFKNIQSLNKYINDYLKIAFGIRFIDVNNFKNEFAKIEEELRNYKNFLDEKLKKDEKNQLLKHFDINNSLEFKDIYEVREKIGLESEKSNIDLIFEAIDNIKFKKYGLNTLITQNQKVEKIKEKCSTIDCLKELKQNNWEIKDDEN